MSLTVIPEEKDKIFSKEDYNSGDGMVTSIWGPPLWFSLHIMSFNYPVNPTEEQIESYRKYFDSLRGVLPCKYCRENYSKNLELDEFKLSDSVLENRESFSRWLYNLHNKINRDLGKENYKTYEEVREIYENFRARCLSEKEEEKDDGKEKGCVKPLYGKKSKCTLRIVPRDNKTGTSLVVEEECLIKKTKILNGGGLKLNIDNIFLDIFNNL